MVYLKDLGDFIHLNIKYGIIVFYKIIDEETEVSTKPEKRDLNLLYNNEC